MYSIRSVTKRIKLSTASRSLWTSSTFSSTSPRSLIDSIPTPPQKSCLTLYTISKHFPQDLLPTLQSTISSTSTSIGCLSEPFPFSSPSNDDSILPPFTLSISHYTPSTNTERIIPFSTSLTGRPNISLGREHKPRAGGLATQEELEFENRQFERFLKGDKNWAFGDQFNLRDTKELNEKGVAEIQELSDVDPRKVKEIVCFTADRIQPFLSVLSQFSNSRTVGMTSTSTPFHSAQNLPFSLFYNDKVSSAGAVGVAVVDESRESSSSSSSGSTVEIDYGDLTKFGPITTVTSSRGNILLTLSSQNAAQLLLSSVQSLPSSNKFIGDSYDSSSPFESSLSNPKERTTKHISKEKDFFAALFNPSDLLLPESESESEKEEMIDLGKAKLVCRIMAGDPKRGAVSFETEEEVEIGDKVVFLHRPSTTTTTTTITNKSSSSSSLKRTPSFSFQTIPPSYVSPIHSSTTLTKSSEEEEKVVVEKLEGFFSFTENGIIVSRESRTNREDIGDKKGEGREVRLSAIEGTSVRLLSK
ncbi:hypothetical protein JCM3765_006205 [Sporobolomyces pararoseus]